MDITNITRQEIMESGLFLPLVVVGTLAFLYFCFRLQLWYNKRPIKEQTTQTDMLDKAENKTYNVVVGDDGCESWFVNDQLHRDGDRPAVIDGDVSEWWYNGMLHRENGPAVVGANGDEVWFFEDKKHRDGGPALIKANGLRQEWYQHGALHREDGPAIDNTDENGKPYQKWFLNGVVMSKEEHNKKLQESEESELMSADPLNGKIMTFDGRNYILTPVSF